MGDGLLIMLRCLAQMLMFMYCRSKVNCAESHCEYLIAQALLMRTWLMKNYLLDFLSRKSMKHVFDEQGERTLRISFSGVFLLIHRGLELITTTF